MRCGDRRAPPGKGIRAGVPARQPATPEDRCHCVWRSRSGGRERQRVWPPSTSRQTFIRAVRAASGLSGVPPRPHADAGSVSQTATSVAGIDTRFERRCPNLGSTTLESCPIKQRCVFQAYGMVVAFLCPMPAAKAASVRINNAHRCQKIPASVMNDWGGQNGRF